MVSYTVKASPFAVLSININTWVFQYKALDQNTFLSVLINTLNGFQAFHDGFCLFGWFCSMAPQKTRGLRQRKSGRRLIKYLTL